MLHIFKSTDAGMINLDQVENGAWVNLVNPGEREISFVSETLNIPVDHIKAALDEDPLIYLLLSVPLLRKTKSECPSFQ